jgi:hypothetical protein
MAPPGGPRPHINQRCQYNLLNPRRNGIADPGL